MLYKHEEIYKVIPSRYPLMFLDSLELGENYAIGRVVLKSDEWFFKCHYPGNPLLPVTLLIDSMAQTFIAIFLQKTDGSETPVTSSIIGHGGTSIKMRETAGPGDSIKIVAKLSSFRRGVAKGTCKAYKNDVDVPICEIDLVEVLPSKMVLIP